MTNAEKRQVNALCDRALDTFTGLDQAINMLEKNEWARFTLAEGDFEIDTEFRNWRKRRINGTYKHIHKQ